VESGRGNFGNRQTYINCRHLDAYMPKRTTLVLDDRVYAKLVSESMRKYGTARNLSKVVNDIVEERTGGKTSDIMELIYSEKIARISEREFEQFRRKLSARFEH
jgi:hypothetical protein